MTGMTTAHTAVVGATTAIVPMASARYSRPTPMLPAIPAIAPQKKSERDGDASGSNGSTSSSMTRPEACDQTTTVMVLARREARPPRKSAAPYSAADAIARRNANLRIDESTN